MSQEATLSPDETQVITNISQSFARRMHWNSRWELDDIYQELCLYWLKRKHSGWKKPAHEWMGAMGRCLAFHLKDIQRRECLSLTRTNGSLASLELLKDGGFDLPAPITKPIFFDLSKQTDSHECHILNLLAEGLSKKVIAQRLGKSRTFVHQKIRSVRHLAEENL